MVDLSVILKTGTAPWNTSTLLKIPRGDHGDNINFTIQNSSGAALDITGTTPKLALYRPDGRRVMSQVMLKDCAIISGTGGTCKYTVQAGDFPDRTFFHARIEIHTGTSKVESTQDFMLEVI